MCYSPLFSFESCQSDFPILSETNANADEEKGRQDERQIRQR